ncbi:hypothetical protein [Nocardia suismassiliense]|uniref:hypothetical protein n=1 Tax=Nocardia suismassiliense TaxID=2077092 RepID=UPI000D1F1F65|nr:hypothetical protein [Nocardia suismassiliense]
MSGELADELRKLENEKRTGVLFVGDGAFHLAEGAVTAADCLRTSGLARLVSEAGVATAEDWRAAEGGHPDRVLAQPRLEILALLSVFDAAYFLLDSPATPEFRPAPPHWLAAVCRIAPHVLVQECVRRGDSAGTPWPARLVDRAPVVPVRRSRRRVVLTAGQAEVLAAADTRRSVTGIGEYLGRTTYGCLVAVRELTAAGLIEPPVPVLPAEAMVNPLRADAVPPRRRRVRPSGSVAAQDRWEPVDPGLLVRLRAALEDA